MPDVAQGELLARLSRGEPLAGADLRDVQLPRAVLEGAELTRGNLGGANLERANLRRAKLTSCQLPTYYVGWREWVRLRDEYRKSKGAGFNLSEFHERVLKPGAVPMPSLSRLL